MLVNASKAQFDEYGQGVEIPDEGAHAGALYELYLLYEVGTLQTTRKSLVGWMSCWALLAAGGEFMCLKELIPMVPCTRQKKRRKVVCRGDLTIHHCWPVPPWASAINQGDSQCHRQTRLTVGLSRVDRSTAVE